MLPFENKQKIPTLQDARLFEAFPANASLILFRRFGHLNNLGVSGSQFNIYRHPQGGYILKMQDEFGEDEVLLPRSSDKTRTTGNEASDAKEFGPFYGGHLPTFAAVYERIMECFTHLLIPSAKMGGPYSQEVIFDTTPGEARRYVCILATNSSGVEETRDQHATELLARYT